MRLRDLGNPRANFAWTDLRAIVNRAYDDPSMQLHRAINPNWRFAEPVTYLLAEIATIESSRRFYDLAQIMEDVPEQYWPATYGPPRDVVEHDEQVAEDRTSRDATARNVAADLRAELVG